MTSCASLEEVVPSSLGSHGARHTLQESSTEPWQNPATYSQGQGQHAEPSTTLYLSFHHTSSRGRQEV